MIAAETAAKLAQPLSSDAVRTREQAGQRLSYVDGHYAITRANEVFGHDGWSYTVRDVREVYRGERPGKDSATNIVLVYEALVRVEALGVVREDVGVGQCDAAPRMLAAGIEKGRKEAVTDALKRALRTFGPSFGLALYDKEQRDVVALPAEALDALDVLAECTDVDAWVKAHKALLASLTPAQKDLVRARTSARRSELPPDGPRGGGAPAPQASANTNATGAAPESAPANGARALAAVPTWAADEEGIRWHLSTKGAVRALENSVRLHGRALAGTSYLHLAAERLCALSPADERGTRLSAESARRRVDGWAEAGPVSASQPTAKAV